MDNNLIIQILAFVWFAYKGLERLILWYKDKHDRGEKEEKTELISRIGKIEDEIGEMRRDLIKKVSYNEMEKINEKLYEIHGKLSSLTEALKQKK